MRLCSLLFTPGSRPDRFDKALAAGADVVVLDLEDAVAPEDKPTARESIGRWIGRERPAIVRINGIETPWFNDDLSLANVSSIQAIMLPKAERPEHIAAVTAAGVPRVIPLIETAAGIVAAREIAKAPGVLCLAFGSLDLQADLGMRDATEDELLPYRAQLILASRLAGIHPPIDGVTPSIDDEERLAIDVARARRLGFAGKLCIHPRQIAAIHRGFTPDATEIAWANKVLKAVADNGAVATVDGKMVDKPVVLRAEAILREANL